MIYKYYNCSSITDFYCFAETVPTTYYNAFDNYYISNATLHVPASAVESYSSSSSWSRFGIIVALETEPVDAVATGTLEIAAVPVLIKSRGGAITVEGVGYGTTVSVYTTGGMLVGSATAVDRTATVGTSLPAGTVAVVKIGEKAVKIVVR